MVKPVTELTDDELADVGGMPGSLEDYKRTMEFRRRDLVLHRKVAEAQISAAKSIKWSAIIACTSVVVAVIGLLSGS